MAEKVNKSYTPFHYHSLIYVCVFYLQLMTLSRNVRFISCVRGQIRYCSKYTVLPEGVPQRQV